MKLNLHRLASPIGTLLLVHHQEVLRALDFDGHEPRMHRLLRLQYGDCTLVESPVPPACRCALEAYFAGDLAAIDRICVQTAGTAFQRLVWAALRAIPAGTTTSYGRLAADLGRQGASRAVGLANGSNPIAIVVPCHRVIGANANLKGYGGGLARKAWLLVHERGV